MANNRQHYLLLDGMRGVAALMVLGFHLFEAVAFAAGEPEQKMFHGFLAVDFFLVLSGFVMGYAYDGEWKSKGGPMSVGGFFKRRLIRLHPMVVMGALIGLVAFVCQGCNTWDGVHVGWGKVLVSALLALFLLPSPGCADVRGNTEIFPLNGPHWSLFFEYLGSIMYALLLRRFSTRVLKAWVALSALALVLLVWFGPEGSIGCGWSSQPSNMLVGFLRMCFDYSAGLLLSRLFHEKYASSAAACKAVLQSDSQSASLSGAPSTVQSGPALASLPGALAATQSGPSPVLRSGHVFWPCAAVLVLLLCMPSFGTMNIVYEFVCVGLAFPALIWLCARGGISAVRGATAGGAVSAGAGSKDVASVEGVLTAESGAVSVADAKGARAAGAKRAMSLLGALSYPLYAVHYPFIYLYIGWINTGAHPFGPYEWCTPVAVAVISVAVALLCMKFYDTPLRRRLTRL